MTWRTGRSLRASAAIPNRNAFRHLPISSENNSRGWATGRTFASTGMWASATSYRRTTAGFGIWPGVPLKANRSPSSSTGRAGKSHSVKGWTAGMPWPRADPALFLQKLGSLARLALSAAVQKRDFLRRHSRNQPAFTRGFLLERARLVVAPVGLEAAVRTLLGRGLCADSSALDLARQIVQRLRDVLRQDGRAVLLETCLDTPEGFVMEGEETPRPDEMAGLTAWDGMAPAKNQLRAAGTLHAIAETGTAAVLLADGELPPPERLVEWLREAWRRTDVVRLRFVRREAPARQLSLGLQSGGEQELRPDP
jgi:hypothetical protein